MRNAARATAAQRQPDARAGIAGTAYAAVAALAGHHGRRDRLGGLQWCRCTGRTRPCKQQRGCTRKCLGVAYQRHALPTWM